MIHQAVVDNENNFIGFVKTDSRNYEFELGNQIPIGYHLYGDPFVSNLG